MTEASSTSTTTPTTSADTSASQSGASVDKQTVASENPKSAWDIVKDIDWGTQHDDLKASAEAGTTFKPGDKVGESSASS
jgi:hypothetical protein